MIALKNIQIEAISGIAGDNLITSCLKIDKNDSLNDLGIEVELILSQERLVKIRLSDGTFAFVSYDDVFIEDKNLINIKII